MYRLGYLLHICGAPRDKAGRTSLYNLTTIVPLGASDFWVIDSTEEQTEETIAWVFNSGL